MSFLFVFSLSGDESLAYDLRYLCAAELFVHAALYTNHEAFVSDDDFGMSLSGTAENVFTSSKNR